jgi:predicted nucleic acid-binding protein
MATLVDTGVLYALADTDDAWHGRAVEWLDGQVDVLAVPVSVIAEVCYLLHARLGTRTERLFVESLARGELAVEALERRDLARAAAVLAKRPELGFVDASIVALAERLGIRRLATTDRRHFAAVRLEGGARLDLVP